MLSGPTATIRRARRLRKAMSLPEVLLWQALRDRPAGLKFRRQQAAGRFVADFYCHSAELSVEVDGECHSYGDRPARDAARDATLDRIGVHVLRIPARDVLSDVEGVVRHIVEVADSISPLHHPSGGPPPLEGRIKREG